MNGWKIVAVGLACLLGGSQLATAADGKAVYDKTCAGCHKTGMMGAPKFGDKDKWAALAQGGQGALEESVAKGKGKMPAAKVPGEDIKAAVDYMVKSAL